jgi:glycosyltransferase involved in cell wall biosynthesis
VKPRALIVTQTGQLGGVECSILDMAPYFEGRSEVVVFADGPLRERLSAMNVPVTVLTGETAMMDVRRDSGTLTAIAAGPALLRLVLRLAAIARNFDVIYANSQKAAIVAMLSGRLARRPVVWHLHDILSEDHFAPLQRHWVARLANVCAQSVIVNSKATRCAFVANGGAHRLVHIVYNGFDPGRFLGAPEEASGLRAEFDPGGCQLVGLFGRISPWKGQRVLIEALPLLPRVHALLIGSAMFGEDHYENGLVARAVALGVSDRVHRLGFRDDVPALMKTVDLVVHTSTSAEPFGRVIVEAMLSRRPVLATNLGGALEILGPSHPHLIPPGDPAALALAITRAFATPPAVMDELLAANYARAERLFSMDRMISGIERELAAATKRPA